MKMCENDVENSDHEVMEYPRNEEKTIEKVAMQSILLGQQNHVNDRLEQLLTFNSS